VSSYVKERVKSAEWIIRSLEQREHTITRVIEYIIHRQHGFLEHGDKLLRPMNLRQVAEHLQLHESTISRAVSNKFVKMPSGTYELKYFFTTGIQTEGGEEASSKTIKAQLRELVEREDKSCPISDQRLSELLLRQGFRISRRTVAKYRDELGILPSSMRKTFR
jgi:RNA polymerase sigma-54 factor